MRYVAWYYERSAVVPIMLYSFFESVSDEDAIMDKFASHESKEMGAPHIIMRLDDEGKRAMLVIFHDGKRISEVVDVPYYEIPAAYQVVHQPNEATKMMEEILEAVRERRSYP